jgi:flagellar motor protein MotB
MKAVKALPVPRWAISFADLVLLLLGCFVLLHAMEAARPKATEAPPAAAVAGWPAETLFQPGEARLLDGARATLAAAARALAGHKVRIVSRGTGAGGARLDRFELAAARAAAVGRALQAGGVAERDIAIALAEGGGPAGQTIALERR